MSDLIKRSDAIEAIEIVDWYHQNRNKDMVSGANSDDHQAWYKADDVYKALEAVPSADRPQGKWKAKSFHKVYCDNCGFDFDIMKCDFMEKMYFCPNCGAKMDGERKESE